MIKGIYSEANNDAENIVSAIKEAKEELARARAMFDICSDPKMVDYCIYTEEAAKARYIYLLGEAKSHGIKVDDEYIVKNLEAV